MRCKNMKRLISRYIDGEIEPKNETILLEHLERCGTCGKEKEAMVSLHKMLAPPSQIEPSPQFMAGLNQKMAPRNSFASYVDLCIDLWVDFFKTSLVDCLKPVSICIVSLLFFILSFYLGNHFGTRLTTEQPPSRKQVVLASFDKTMDISIFNDVPRNSFASAYVNVLKESKK